MMEKDKVIKTVVRILKKHGLKVGMHDCEIVCFSPKNDVREFTWARDEIIEKFKIRMPRPKGSEKSWLRYEMKIGKSRFCLVFVKLV